MDDDRDVLADWEAAVRAAMRPAPPMQAVTLDTAHGTECLLYSLDNEGLIREGGRMLIPADTPENRRRQLITRGCPLCPDVNQGMVSHERDLGPDGVYVFATYQECRHIVGLRLDEDDAALFFGTVD